MKLSRSIAIAVGACLVLATAGSQVAVQAQEPQIEVWTPLPVKPNPFVPPHKAWTKLSEVLAKHKGQQNWSELIVDDNLFHGEYISMAPGAKTPRRFHQDNRAFWIVQDGQIRFTIEGQEPFVATQGLPRAGAEAAGLQHGDRRRQAVAAVRSADGEFSDDVSGR